MNKRLILVITLVLTAILILSKLSSPKVEGSGKGEKFICSNLTRCNGPEDLQKLKGVCAPGQICT